MHIRDETNSSCGRSLDIVFDDVVVAAKLFDLCTTDRLVGGGPLGVDHSTFGETLSGCSVFNFGNDVCDIPEDTHVSQHVLHVAN
jgi:hypothetical protein